MLTRAQQIPTLAAALATLALTGCPNVANLTTARVLDPGTVEITVAPAVTGMSAAFFDSSESGTLTAGTLDLGVRAGLADIVDFGFRISNMGNLNLDVKVGLLDSPALRIALDPTIGGVFLSAGSDEDSTSAGYFQFDLPVLFDLVFNDHLTLSLAPRYTLLYLFAEGETTPASHLLGGALGFEIALGDSFALQPNAGIAFWVNGPDDVSTSFFSAGIAFKFLLGGSRLPTPDTDAMR
jgi:hypothetical protein